MYKNKLFKTNDPIQYLNKYLEDKYNLIKKIDNKLFLKIIEIVDKTLKKKNNIFVCEMEVQHQHQIIFVVILSNKFLKIPKLILKSLVCQII